MKLRLIVDNTRGIAPEPRELQTIEEEIQCESRRLKSCYRQMTESDFMEEVIAALGTFYYNGCLDVQGDKHKF